MELKRIIKEEINDFDWADKIKPSMGMNFDELKFGDIVNVNGEVRPQNGRPYTFNDSKGMVIHNELGFLESGTVVIAFDSSWGQQGFSVGGGNKWYDKLYRLLKKNHQAQQNYCKQHNCYRFTSHDIERGLTIEPTHENLELDIKVRESIKEEILKENTKQHLESLAKMMGGNQKKYYDWQLDNLEVVPVVSHKHSEEFEEVIDTFIKKMRRFGSFCEKKGCFDTAYNAAMYVPGVHYIEGYVDSIIPIVHAWNYLPKEGIYFDLINDIAWSDEDAHFKQYYKILELDKGGVLKWSSKTGYGGGFMESPQFMKSIIENEEI